MKNNLPLKRSYFARNKYRETRNGGLFGTMQLSLSFMMKILLPAVLTPSIVISCIFSEALILSLLNIFLSLGYCAHFFQRMLLKEVSSVELIASALAIGGLVALAIYLSPITLSLNLLMVLNCFNLAATAINTFALLRNFILPVCQTILQKISAFMHQDLQIDLFRVPPLTLERDRPAIDRLLLKFYQQNSFDKAYSDTKLQALNKLVRKLTWYIARYHQSLFGSVINADKITKLETVRDQLVSEGNSDGAIGFINKKIAFKTTKLRLLKHSCSILEDDTVSEAEKKAQLLKFFKPSQQQLKTDIPSLVTLGVFALKTTIDTQQNKIDELSDCIPH